MLNFDDVSLEQIIIHKVGNRSNDDGVKLSKNQLQIDDDVKHLLMNYFLSPFDTDAFYRFTDETGLENHPVYNHISSLFADNNSFYDISVKLAEFLYEKSEHPKIKQGEFYVVLFKNCVVDDEITDAIGLFKSENKETFIKIYQQNENFEVKEESGVNIKKLDKGCIVFHTEREAGYKLCIVDKTNKGSEARFWRDDFLHVELMENDFYQTQNYMNICKNFVEDVYNEEHNVEKPDQIGMLNRSVNYFKENEDFDTDGFTQDVMMGEQEVVDAFNNYKNQYVQENNLKLNDNFQISDNAVKDGKRYFKSVLKLDKNFHVYIHGKREYVEKGFDEEKNLNYYKLYFEDES